VIVEYPENYSSCYRNIQKGIPSGSVVAVTGRNGAGKSTFLRCVCGLENYCPGRIIMGGREYKGKERRVLCLQMIFNSRDGAGAPRFSQIRKMP